MIIMTTTEDTLNIEDNTALFVSGVFTDARASAIIRTDNNGNQRRYMYPMWKEKTRIDIPSVAVHDPFPIENYVNNV